jgi:bifunctional NMN adenylyltransferase/nudix hydrolase
MKQYDLIVVTGRFQPFHNGHYSLLAKALELAKDVLVLIGSAKQPRTIKNPFTAEERGGMIAEALSYPIASNVHFGTLIDTPYDNSKWAQQVKCKVGASFVLCGIDKPKIGILGYKKDNSSFYLDLFPEWDFIDAAEIFIPKLDATDIRHHYFRDIYPQADKYIADRCPQSTLRFLKEFRKTSMYANLVMEDDYYTRYHNAWAKAPYPPIFVTVDACVFHGPTETILLIKRKNHPGKDLWALPGGFVNLDEKLDDAVLRELQEETGLVLSHEHEGFKETFDLPTRSLRGRSITFGYLFILEGECPEITAADDAVDYVWWPIYEIDQLSDMLFEDHLSIIKRMTR